MKIREITDKNLVWQQLAAKNSIQEIQNFEVVIKEYSMLIDAVYSTTLNKNARLPGLTTIKESIKNIKVEIENHPDQQDPDIINARSKLIEIETLLNKYK